MATNIGYVGSMGYLGAAGGGLSTPSLAIADGVATISGSDAAFINILEIAERGTQKWHAYSNITGDGTITITGMSNGDYVARVMSIPNAATAGTASGSVDFTVTNGTITSNLNEHWARWIFASISDHFNTRRGTMDMFIEGQHRDTRTKKDFFELRMDGPYYTEISKQNFKIYIEINALLQSSADDNNYHRIWTNLGLVGTMFTDIPIYKYGSGIDDDQSYLGCLKLIQNARGRDNIQSSYFGRIEPSTPIYQATVEGHYDMTLVV